MATFQAHLTEAYRELFASDPAYAAVRDGYTIHGNLGTSARPGMSPEALAAKMTAGLRDGSASHDGAGIRRACKAVGIKPTRTAIRAYLESEIA